MTLRALSLWLLVLFVSPPAQAGIWDWITSWFTPWTGGGSDPDSNCATCTDLIKDRRKQCHGNPNNDISEIYGCHTITENGQCITECLYDHWSGGPCKMTATTPACAVDVMNAVCQKALKTQVPCGEEMTIPGW